MPYAPPHKRLGGENGLLLQLALLQPAAPLVSRSPAALRTPRDVYFYKLRRLWRRAAVAAATVTLAADAGETWAVVCGRFLVDVFRIILVIPFTTCVE
jgi:hypothetical protein